MHRWVVVTLTNSGAEARDIVVATPHQGFAGSGVLWPRPIGSRIQNVVAAGQATIAPLRVINSDAFALRIEPKGKVTVAMELTRAGLDEIEMWQRIAFDAKSEQAGFYRGVVLGIAMLIGIVAISLYTVRTIAVFPFASVFLWSAIGFIALESGYLAQINDALPKSYELGPEVRAVIEGLMLIGLILCLVSFADLRKRRRISCCSPPGSCSPSRSMAGSSRHVPRASPVSVSPSSPHSAFSSSSSCGAKGRHAPARRSCPGPW